MNQRDTQRKKMIKKKNVKLWNNYKNTEQMKTRKIAIKIDKSVALEMARP